MLKPFLVLDRFLSLKRRLAERPGNPSGVLLFSCGGLGDMVLFALVLPRFASLARDGEPVTVLISQAARKMTFLFPPAVDVIAVDFRRLRKSLPYRWKTAQALFEANYRLVVSCDFLRHPDLDEALVAACGAAETIAMEPRSWAKYARRLNRNRNLYTRLWDSGAIHRDKVVRWAGFAGWLTGHDEPPPRLSLPMGNMEQPIPPATPTVVMQPFSALKEKQSPAALFERIIDALPDGYRVVITGGPGDLEGNPDFKGLLDKPNVDFDPSHFEAVVPLLRSAKLVVSVDTALMHLAVAVGAPTLCLASAAYVGEIVPYDPSITPGNVHFMYHSMPCEGCLADCRLPREDGMFPCVARLDGTGIVRKVEELISDN